MGPDGLGSYAAKAADVPPVMAWPEQPQVAPAAGQSSLAPAPAAPAAMPTPDDYVVASAQPQDQVPLASDPWPAMAAVAARRPSRAVEQRRAMAGGFFENMDAAAVDRAMLGAAFVIVGVGSAVGASRGGLFGSLAGGLYGGAVVNTVRAVRVMKSDSKEAVLSGTFAIVGAGIATYLLWKSRDDARGRGKSRSHEKV